MNCSLELLQGYVDGELDQPLHFEVVRHVAECPACAEAAARLIAQAEAVRSAAPYYPAPPGLQDSIKGALQRRARESFGPSPRWRWAAIAASLLLACSAAWNVTQLRHSAGESSDLPRDLVSSHVRSLIGTHLMDVVSTDRHTVKPWFNGKIDFSPQVKDLAPQGFPLVGGRLEYLDNRTVAALIYQRRQHVINLFTWPSASADRAPTHLLRNGFNLVHWSDGAMTYWAVSDLALPELEQFQRTYTTLP